MARTKSIITRRAEDQTFANSLFASIGDGIIATDEFGHITDANPAACKILGFKTSELIGEWFPKKLVALGNDHKAVELIDRPIAKAFLTGRTVSERTNYRRKNGEILPVALTVSPIINDGKPIGAIEVFRDVTLEDEIDRMKSEFISLASHQLRTPLSAIKTYTHMLLDGYMGELSETQKQTLKTVVGATNRMNELISMLLNIARMEAGTINVNPKSARLDRVVKDIVNDHNFQATEKDISLVLEESSNIPEIKTDLSIAKEVISNLVGNAIKYTPTKGKVDVKVQARRYDILISITDTGVGIPKYSQDQVFTKFFRANNVIKQETSGIGLGLYLAKGLISAIEGKIWFKSEEGKGSVFYISFPKQLKVKCR